MISKKKRIKELEAKLAETKAKLEYTESENKRLMEINDNIQKRAEETKRKMTDLVNSLAEVPEGCKVGKLCELCAHRKKIYVEGSYVHVYMCDLSDHCPNFAPTGKVVIFGGETK